MRWKCGLDWRHGEKRGEGVAREVLSRAHNVKSWQAASSRSRLTRQRESGVKPPHSKGSIGGTSAAGPDWKVRRTGRLKSLPHFVCRHLGGSQLWDFWERNPNHLNSDFFIVARPIPVEPNVFPT